MTETILRTPLLIVRRWLKNRAPVLRLSGPSFNKVLTRPARATEHVAAACVAILLFTASVRAAERQALRGHVPRAIADLNLQPVGLLSGTNRLHLAIGLPLRNQEALTNLLQQIYDPGSPVYHQYLTPEQFTEKFGPTEPDYQAIIAFAKATGLTVTGTHPNRVVLDLEGSVADIEKAFHIALRVYQHPTDARTFYAPDTEPSIDLSVPILHISGLDNYTLPFPKLVRKPTTKVTAEIANAGSGPGGTYLGYDFRKAYVPGTTLTGVGQSVALFELDGYYAVDISNYVALAGLPYVPLVNVPVNGGIGTPGVNGGIDEVSLDIEMVIAMAPGLSQVYVYEGLDPDSVLNKIAVDNLAQQISCSWGWSPGPDLTADNIFMQMAVQGQTFFNASGDSDAFLPGTADEYAPATSPTITQVGGTTLTTTGPGGSYVSETVWNWGLHNGSYIGSSGGVSSYYPIPYYQQGINMTANGGSTTMRDVPDVALTADNVYVIANKGADNGSFGGTSCAAPLWAGFIALVNQQAAINSLPPVGFINPAFYAMGKGTNYTSTFHDTTTGNNEWPSSPSRFAAVAGYDLCTGWGTPNGTNLINALVVAATSPYLVGAGSVVSGGNGNGVIDYDECNLLYFPIRNIGGGTATTVNATLTTSTPGVTITQPTSTYPNLVRGAITTNSTPFQISTSPAFVCGTPIPLSLVLSYTQGLTTNTITMSTCQCPLSQVTGSLTGTDAKQTGRLTRDGNAAACGSSKSCPGYYTTSGARAYDRYSFTNSSSSAACVTVTLSNSCSGNIFAVAYLGSFNPASLCSGYLADMGLSPNPTGTFSFNVPAYTNFTVVVHVINASSTCSSYTLTVAGLTCLTDGGGQCSLPPSLAVVPLSLAFGSVVIGQTNTLPFSVINNGGQALTGTASVTGPFAIASGSPYNVAPAATGTVQVSFIPIAAGAASNTLVFASNGGVSSNAVTGTGLTPGVLAVSPPSLNFGTIATGTTAQLSFALTNSGGASISGTAAVQGGTTFSIVSGGSFNVGGFGTTNVVVQFAPASVGTFTTNVLFTSTGGNSTNAVTGVGAIAPLAIFSGAPTSGVAPLAVTFTDTSTGTITNRFWDFGDSATTNTTATSVQHTYNAAGTNTVTLIVSGPLGVSTNTQANYVTVLTPYQGWQMQYFGCIGCAQAAETADPDGDGQNNLAEFLAGTDPTNSASALDIISIVQEGDDVRVGWLAGGGRTNVVQAVNDAGSGFTNNFSDLSPLFIIPGAGDVLTNYLDVGGATNAPSRFYRVRLVP